MVVKSFLILSLLLISTEITFSQKISDEFCKEIFINVIEPVKPIEVSRNEVFSRDCVFEFTLSNKIDVSIDIEKYGSEKEAQKELKNILYLFTMHYEPEKLKLSRRNLKEAGYWDKAVIFDKIDDSSGFALLRKQNFLITILTLDEGTLFEFERLLRRIKLG
jgi:hypothetical protein